MSPFAATAPRLDQMPMIKFGKHKGRYIHELPSDYIIWCLNKTKSDGAFQDHKDWFLAELASRGTPFTGTIDPTLTPPPWTPPESPGKPPSKATNGNGSAKLLIGADLRNLMKTCYGEMSKKYHPDRGGRDGQQQVVIDYHRTLMTALETWEKSK